MRDKDKLIYTKEMLIKNIAAMCSKDSNSVRTIYNALEEVLSKSLSNANLNQDVVVKLFEGISVSSTFIPEERKINNLTGKVITSMSKIRPKANITRNYRDKLTAYSK